MHLDDYWRPLFRNPSSLGLYAMFRWCHIAPAAYYHAASLWPFGKLILLIRDTINYTFEVLNP